MFAPRAGARFSGLRANAARPISRKPFQCRIQVLQRDELVFSVVVPLLNERRWIGQVLSALSAQTLDPALFEIVAVDNGSTDGSLEILSRHPRISILHEARRDPYLARNRGIAAAQGHYIVFVDADCIPRTDWLERLHNQVVDADPHIVLGHVGFPEGSSAFLRRYEEYYHAKLEYLFGHRLTDYYFGHAGNMAVRADVFANLGYFVPMPVVGDTEILHRLLGHERTVEIRYAPEVRVVHAEIESLPLLLRKLFESGGYSETCQQLSSYRIIPPSLKYRIFRACMQQNHYGPLEAATALAMLLAGWLTFACGHLSTKWRTRAASQRLAKEPEAL